jgi:Obg family GTPase CgtA-like protein
VERVAQQTEFDNPESIALFQRTLDRMGVTKALSDVGARSGSTVNIAGIELEWQ